MNADEVALDDGEENASTPPAALRPASISAPAIVDTT
jgi:hypothetical protein